MTNIIKKNASFLYINFFLPKKNTLPCLVTFIIYREPLVTENSAGSPPCLDCSPRSRTALFSCLDVRSTSASISPWAPSRGREEAALGGGQP